MELRCCATDLLNVIPKKMQQIDFSRILFFTIKLGFTVMIQSTQSPTTDNQFLVNE